MRIDLESTDTPTIYRHTYARSLDLETRSLLIAEGITGRFEPVQVDGFGPWEAGTNHFGFNVFVCESVR